MIISAPMALKRLKFMSTIVLRKATKVETENTPMSRLNSMVGVRVMEGMKGLMGWDGLLI